MFFFRILCYNAGLEDASRLGEPEREYIDEILGRIYAIEYSPKGRRFKFTMHKTSKIYRPLLYSLKKLKWIA